MFYHEDELQYPVEESDPVFAKMLQEAIGGVENLAADMYANVIAESSGRLLVTRLYTR